MSFLDEWCESNRWDVYGEWLEDTRLEPPVAFFRTPDIAGRELAARQAAADAADAAREAARVVQDNTPTRDYLAELFGPNPQEQP